MSENSDKVFRAAVEKTLRHEGKYVNNPDDKGGPTNWGITQETARQNGYTGDMRLLTVEQAIDIYKRRYWTGPAFDQLSEISAPIASLLFDIGVNTGTGTGVKFLQRALNALNRQGKDYPDMAVDGGCGPTTRAALSKFKAIRSREGERVLIGMIRAQLSVYYLEISETRPQNETFVYGWQLNRALGDV